MSAEQSLLASDPLAPIGSTLGEGDRYLALDVGLARIGVALADPLGLSARPLLTLRRRSRNEDFAALARLVKDHEVTGVICGLPLHMDGNEGTQAATTRKWAMRLAQALRAILGYPLPVIFWDERLSSFTARDLQEAGYPTAGEDALAAAVILQAFLDARRSGDTRSFGRIDLPQRPAPTDANELDAVTRAVEPLPTANDIV